MSRKSSWVDIANLGAQLYQGTQQARVADQLTQQSVSIIQQNQLLHQQDEANKMMIETRRYIVETNRLIDKAELVFESYSVYSLYYLDYIKKDFGERNVINKLQDINDIQHAHQLSDRINQTLKSFSDRLPRMPPNILANLNTAINIRSISPSIDDLVIKIKKLGKKREGHSDLISEHLANKKLKVIASCTFTLLSFIGIIVSASVLGGISGGNGGGGSDLLLLAVLSTILGIITSLASLSIDDKPIIVQFELNELKSFGLQIDTIFDNNGITSFKNYQIELGKSQTRLKQYFPQDESYFIH
ncbi:MAG: hypothetical protein HOE69_04540 [Euryarchaeota archaeon]|nr:hypothetical protein [Euryarchaeota archaeon]